MEGMPVRNAVRVAVLMTCYNRKGSTLRCLRSLAASWKDESEIRGDGRATLDVWLNDDGCTDGTVEEVREFELGVKDDGFAVHIVKGSGSDFWARGMERAWQAAGSGHDYYLWLNDDVELNPDALAKLLAASKPTSVVVGECCDPDDGKAKTYGVQGRWFNGNVVLVPREVFKKVGMIDGSYAHSKADYDYAERVRRAGFDIVATDGFVGMCRADWQERFKGRDLLRRLHMMFEPCYWNIHDLWRFRLKYYGLARALTSCARLVWIVMKGVK